MTEIKCPECGVQLFNAKKVCPQCGGNIADYVEDYEKGRSYVGKVAIIAAIKAVVIGLVVYLIVKITGLGFGRTPEEAAGYCALGSCILILLGKFFTDETYRKYAIAGWHNNVKQ